MTMFTTPGGKPIKCRLPSYLGDLTSFLEGMHQYPGGDTRQFTRLTDYRIPGGQGRGQLERELNTFYF